MADLIKLEVADAIAVVTFDNPPRGYMTIPQVMELDPIVDTLAADPAVRVVVFTGAVDNVFIRHFDVATILDSMMVEARASGLDAEGLVARALSQAGAVGILEKIERMPKPTIAAINGFAQGGGFEFALCCDLRITQPGDFRIGLPETSIGITPGGGGTERLPRLIGEARALELILRGRTLPPEEAARLGLVHECAPQGALPRALEIARELAAKAPGALALAKSLVRGTTERPLAEAVARGRGGFNALIAFDPDAERLMRRFLETGEDINQG
jgi:enoyl-CoA hydratase/carnithine racemase